MSQERWVELGARRYPVGFHHAAEDRLVAALQAAAPGGRLILVTDDTVQALHGARLAGALRAAGVELALLSFPAGEPQKTAATLMHLTDAALGFGVDRGTPVVAFGGGVVGDLAGLLAAVLLRGLPFIQVPTTVLAQVDSSVGGKVGINHPRGKNLIGAFHQPRWVHIDTAYLATLPLRARRAGLAEAVKHGALARPELLERLSALPPALPPDRLLPIIADAVAIKADVVEGDEEERGLRQHLNLGHTLGHALEAESLVGPPEAALQHGEAVSLGLAWAIERSVALCGLPALEGARVVDTLRGLGLPTDWRPRLSAGVIERLAFDKKIRRQSVNLVLLERLGRPVIRPTPLADLRAWLEPR